jgi:hypothetical protein
MAASSSTCRRSPTRCSAARTARWWSASTRTGSTTAPSAHPRAGSPLVMGGVLIDEWGGADRPGLYACGETAGGVHGGNASTATRCRRPRSSGTAPARRPPAMPARPSRSGRRPGPRALDRPARRDPRRGLGGLVRAQGDAHGLRDAMWLGLGIVRTEAGLGKAGRARGGHGGASWPVCVPRRWASWSPRRSWPPRGRRPRVGRQRAVPDREPAAHYREDHPRYGSRLGRDRRLRGRPAGGAPWPSIGTRSARLGRPAADLRAPTSSSSEPHRDAAVDRPVRSDRARDRPPRADRRRPVRRGSEPGGSASPLPARWFSRSSSAAGRSPPAGWSTPSSSAIPAPSAPRSPSW